MWETESKRCTKCGKWLPLDCFGKDNKNRMGLRSRCKKCRSADNVDFLKRNPKAREIRRVCSAKWHWEHRAHCLSLGKQYYQENKEAKLRYGKLLRRERMEGLYEWCDHTCLQCGRRGRVFFHHILGDDDKYDNISNMVTLSWNNLLIELNKTTPICMSCHKQAHLKLGREVL